MAAVVQQNDLVFEFASNVMEDEQQVWDPETIGFLLVYYYDSSICSRKLFTLKDSRRNFVM